LQTSQKLQAMLSYGYGIKGFLCTMNFSLTPHQMSDQCAIGSDGQLKDASEIEWFNDVDDDSAMLPPPPALKASSSAGTLNAFVQLRNSGKTPTPISAGSHRSGWVTKPTEKAHATATSSSISGSATCSVLAKRSIMVDSQNSSALKCIFTSAKKKGDDNDDVDGNDNNKIPELQDVSDDDDEDGDDGEEAYNVTKMFGDMDHEVCLLQFLRIFQIGLTLFQLIGLQGPEEG
jgi:hypothetical protein